MESTTRTPGARDAPPHAHPAGTTRHPDPLDESDAIDGPTPLVGPTSLAGLSALAGPDLLDGPSALHASGAAPPSDALRAPTPAREPDATRHSDATRQPDAAHRPDPVQRADAAPRPAPTHRLDVTQQPSQKRRFDVVLETGAAKRADAGEPVVAGGALGAGRPGAVGEPWGRQVVERGAATGVLREVRRAPEPTVTVGGAGPRTARGARPAPGAAGAPRRMAADDAEWDSAVRATAPDAYADEPRERPGSALPGWCAVLAGLVALASGGALLWWAGALPARGVEALGLPVRRRSGTPPWLWAAVAAAGAVALLAFGGLGRGRVGSAWVLSAFGRYRGSVRRTGLVWISPLVLRRRVDVRLRHWRGEPMPVVDARGVELRVVVLVVWRVRDTARAVLSVDDHVGYLREQVEATVARVLSRLPADTYGEAPGAAAGQAHPAPGPADGAVPATLRDGQAVGDALTRVLAARCEPVGLTVYSAQPISLVYAPEVAAAMQRSQLAAIDARHRDSVLTTVVDAVDDTVHRLTARGLVELDDYERKALVKDLTVAFYTARGAAPESR
ncbi:SPFH domain-containing protein [Streptomyces buecherae]|uniref:SPFH domain-containing protein n=1 Tax=Streptomyces buecherae TaxID=2763006 RepID=UPI0033E6EF9B